MVLLPKIERQCDCDFAGSVKSVSTPRSHVVKHDPDSCVEKTQTPARASPYWIDRSKDGSV